MSLKKVLLSGISDFWTRYFADTDILEALHEGTLEAVAGAYKELVSTVLTQSYDTVPLTETVPWEPLFIFDSDVYESVSSIPGETRYLVELPYDIRYLSLVHNKVLDPTAALEIDFDFEIIANDAARFEELRSFTPFTPSEGYYIAFKDDPFRVYAEGEANPYRRFSINSFPTTDFVRLTDPNTNFLADGFQPVSVGDILRATGKDGVVTLHRITAVSTNYVEVSPRTPFIAEGGLTTYSIGNLDRPTYDSVLSSLVDGAFRSTATISSRSREAKVLSAWVPDPSKDFYSLYYMYGHSVSLSETPSTEEYRSFVKGIWNLYLRGPSLENIEGALCVVSGIPVVRDEEETIQEVDLRDPLIPKVTTDLNDYEFLKYTRIRSDVIAAASVFNGEQRLGTVRLLTDSEVVDAGGFIDFLGAEIGMVLVPEDPNEAVAEISWVTDTYLMIREQDSRPDAYLPAEGGAARSYTFEDSSGNAAPGLFITSGVWLRNASVPLTLTAYSTLADAFVVTDHVEDPDWWYSTTIPHTLTTLPFVRRNVTTEVFENYIGSDAGLVAVGDIGKLIGRDEERQQCLYMSPQEQGESFLDCSVGDVVRFWLDGDLVASSKVVSEIGNTIVFQMFSVLSESFSANNDPRLRSILLGTNENPVPSREIDIVRLEPISGAYLEVIPRFSLYGTNGAAQFFENGGTYSQYLRYHPGVHHNIAWQVMEKYLKHNTFTVSWDANTQQFERDRSFYLDLILSAKPAGTYPYVEPGSTLIDRMRSPLDDPPPGTAASNGPRNLYRRIIILDHPHQRAGFDLNKMSKDEGFPLQITGMENVFFIGTRPREYLLVGDTASLSGVGESNFLAPAGIENGIDYLDENGNPPARLFVEFQANSHSFSGQDSLGVVASPQQNYSVPIEWASSFREVDATGTPIDSYRGLIKLNHVPGEEESLDLESQGWGANTFTYRIRAESSDPALPDYYPVFNNLQDVVRDSSRVIGGIGTTPGLIIGGHDPFIGFHETHASDWSALGGGDLANYRPHGIPQILRSMLMLRRFPLAEFSSYTSTTQTIPGDSTTFQAQNPPWYEGIGDAADPIGSLTIVPEVEDTRHMLLSDETLELTITMTDHDPEFVSSPFTKASVGEEFVYGILVYDANIHALQNYSAFKMPEPLADSLTITADQKPDWLVLEDLGNGKATLKGTPDSAGDFDVILRVEDSTGGTDTQEFSIRVNAAPSFVSSPASLLAGTDSLWLYNVVCSDANPGDTLKISSEFLPPWLTLTDNGDGTASLQGTPTQVNLGEWGVGLVVQDNEGLKGRQLFHISVEEIVIQLPVFQSNPVETVQSGSGYVYNVSVQDPDALPQEITIHATSVGGGDLPGWLLFSDNGNGTGLLSGSPLFGDIGSHQILLTAYSNEGLGNQEVVTQSFTIDVTPVLPAFQSAPVENATTGFAYQYTASVIDADAAPESLSFELISSPGWLSMVDDGVAAGARNATLSGLPGVPDIGDHSVTLRAYSNEGQAGEEFKDQSFTITVAEDLAPVFTSAGVLVGGLDVAYLYDITVNDPDGNNADLVISVDPQQALPAWATFEDFGGGSARISGTPDSTDQVNVSLIASSNVGVRTATQVFTITVFEVLPEFEQVPPLAVDTGEEFTYTFTVHDPDSNVACSILPFPLDGLPAWLSLEDNGDFTATLSGTAEGSGVLPLSIQAVDSDNNVTILNFELTVNSAQLEFISHDLPVYDFAIAGFDYGGGVYGDNLRGRHTDGTSNVSMAFLAEGVQFTPENENNVTVYELGWFTVSITHASGATQPHARSTGRPSVSDSTLSGVYRLTKDGTNTAWSNVDTGNVRDLVLNVEIHLQNLEFNLNTLDDDLKDYAIAGFDYSDSATIISSTYVNTVTYNNGLSPRPVNTVANIRISMVNDDTGSQDIEFFYGDDARNPFSSYSSSEYRIHRKGWLYVITYDGYYIVNFKGTPTLDQHDANPTTTFRLKLEATDDGGERPGALPRDPVYWPPLDQPAFTLTTFEQDLDLFTLNTLDNNLQDYAVPGIGWSDTAHIRTRTPVTSWTTANDASSIDNIKVSMVNADQSTTGITEYDAGDQSNHPWGTGWTGYVGYRSRWADFLHKTGTSVLYFRGKPTLDDHDEGDSITFRLKLEPTDLNGTMPGAISATNPRDPVYWPPMDQPAFTVTTFEQVLEFNLATLDNNLIDYAIPGYVWSDTANYKTSTQVTTWTSASGTTTVGTSSNMKVSMVNADQSTTDIIEYDAGDENNHPWGSGWGGYIGYRSRWGDLLTREGTSTLYFRGNPTLDEHDADPNLSFRLKLEATDLNGTKPEALSVNNPRDPVYWPPVDQPAFTVTTFEQDRDQFNLATLDNNLKDYSVHGFPYSDTATLHSSTTVDYWEGTTTVSTLENMRVSIVNDDLSSTGITTYVGDSNTFNQNFSGYEGFQKEWFNLLYNAGAGASTIYFKGTPDTTSSPVTFRLKLEVTDQGGTRPGAVSATNPRDPVYWPPLNQPAFTVDTVGQTISVNANSISSSNPQVGQPYSDYISYVTTTTVNFWAGTTTVNTYSNLEISMVNSDETDTGIVATVDGNNYLYTKGWLTLTNTNRGSGSSFRLTGTPGAGDVGDITFKVKLELNNSLPGAVPRDPVYFEMTLTVVN